MKRVTITLTQDPEIGLYRVISLTNTVQLSIGQIVKHATVEGWCTSKGVTVKVQGMTEQPDQQPLLMDAKERGQIALV